jgi:hypothetical protein
MRFWWREIAGWLLVLLGLATFVLCIDMLINAHAVLQSGPVLVIGIIIFRAGIHLLKVAVAARICLHARREMADDRRRPARPAPQYGSGRAGAGAWSRSAGR